MNGRHRAGAPSVVAVRTRHEILQTICLANCPECWQVPGTPCAQNAEKAHGFHVARAGRALRRGLITGQELVTILQTEATFNSATLIWVKPAVTADELAPMHEARLGHLASARNAADHLCGHLVALQNGVSGLDGRGPYRPGGA